MKKNERVYQPTEQSAFHLNRMILILSYDRNRILDIFKLLITCDELSRWPSHGCLRTVYLEI